MAMATLILNIWIKCLPPRRKEFSWMKRIQAPGPDLPEISERVKQLLRQDHGSLISRPFMTDSPPNRPEVDIYKRKQEKKKKITRPRKRSRKKENDQEKKK